MFLAPVSLTVSDWNWVNPSMVPTLDPESCFVAGIDLPDIRIIVVINKYFI